MVYRVLTVFIIFTNTLCLIQQHGQKTIVNGSPQSRKVYKKSSYTVSDYLLKGKSFEQTKPDSAWFYYKKARDIAIQQNDQRGLSDYVSHAIVLLNKRGKYPDALDLGDELINIGFTLKDTSILIKGYNDIANDYEYLGALQEASENYLTALKLADKLQNNSMQQRLNNNIASIFIELKDYNRANSYAMKSYEMASANADTAAMGSCLINLGIAELHLNQNDLALKHFNKTIKIGKLVNDVTLIGDARINKGVVYTNQKDFINARKEYKQVQLIAEKYNLPDYSLYALFSLAVLDQQELKFKQASELTKQAISIGEKLGAAEELREMYDTLSVILEKAGDLKGALLYRKKYEVLNDSTMSDRVKTNINRLQIQYKAAKKDKQIAIQNLRLAKNKSIIQRKNILLFLFSLSILILVLLILLEFRYYRQKQKLQKQAILNYQKEQEVVRLKAIMKGKDEERRRISKEIHDDIGSALTTIMYLCNNLNGNKVDNKQSIHKISSTAGGIVDKMNEIIWSMNNDYDTLEDLVTYIRYNSVDLLEGNGIKYEFQIPDNIPDIKIEGEKRRNLYLVSKEALHNIIKHANASLVSLRIEINDNLFIRISDNGKGIDPSNLKKFGNGLKNMKQRMEDIGGTFEVHCENGTSVHVCLPIKNKPPEMYYTSNLQKM